MKFRTKFSQKNTHFNINYNDSILLIGSCFSSNIGNKLNSSKFNTFINPFGVVYNPVSIFNTISSILSKKTYTKDDLFFNNGLWNSFDFHSSFSNTDENECLNAINASVQDSYTYFQSSSKVIITLGTAFVYKLNKTGKIVSNCHKVVQKEFTRYRLSLNETSNYLSKIIDLLKILNPSIQILFTVSPIRHLSDGFEENQRSKSTLILAIDEIFQKNKQCSYFPSYEILMDDLRDYRFYKDDLTHPNNQAIEYIWKHFSESYFNNETKKNVIDIYKIIKASEHRPFNPRTPEHQLFVNKQLDRIHQLTHKNESLNFENEIYIFKSQLI